MTSREAGLCSPYQKGDTPLTSPFRADGPESEEATRRSAEQWENLGSEALLPDASPPSPYRPPPAPGRRAPRAQGAQASSRCPDPGSWSSLK